MFTEVAQKAHLIIQLLLIISDFPIFLNDRGYYETWIFFYPWKILFHVSLYTHPLCWLWFAGISAFMCKSELLEGWWRRLVWVLAGRPAQQTQYQPYAKWQWNIYLVVWGLGLHMLIQIQKMCFLFSLITYFLPS